MKKVLFFFIGIIITFNIQADELVLLKTAGPQELENLTKLERLTINYPGNGFVIATKSGDLKQEFILLDAEAWQSGQNYFLAFANKSKNISYTAGIINYAQILYQTDDFLIFKVSDKNIPDVNPPQGGSLTRIWNKKVKLPSVSLAFPQTKADPDPFIVARMDEVDTILMKSNLQHLQDYGTRNAYNAQSIVAQNWLKQQFESYGLSTQLFDFTMPGGPASDNVIATKTGTLYPDEYVIIGSHYDSYSSSGNAPGADDNASGTVGVLEIARILSNYDFDRTIIFCNFSGEEYGLYGSRAYASWCESQNLDILGYLNMDMIGYLKPGDPIHTDIIAPASAQPLVDYYTSVVNMYLPTFITAPGALSGGDSDHTAFNEHGYMGIFPFEDSQDYSPYIHTSNDLIGLSVNNFEQVEIFTQAILATTISLANMILVDITIDQPDFEVSLPADEITSQQLNIGNAGDPDLNYFITKQYLETGKDPLAYCTASGGCDEYISSITFNTLSNTSGTCSSGGYGNYTSMSTTVDAGQSYNFSYTIGTYYSSDDIGVWIDWNQNDVFTDPGENVVCAYSVPSTGNYTILVPEDAPDGATRMRVRIKYYNSDCGSPCGTATYGEVEDYTIIVNSSPYNWLTVSPTSGTISGHDEMPVTLSFNSEGLAEGDYHANVKINSNDPDEPQVIVPCTLHVTDQINIDLTAMLEGPYSGSEMLSSLNATAILPLNQPFNSAPWNYSGTESVTSIPNADVVDWVLVELRQTPGEASSATPATMVGRQPAFILKDGSIVDLDGVSVLRFDLVVNQNLYAVVYHRNHLGIMSANPLVKSGGNYLLDFSSGAEQAHGGISAQKEVIPGVWAMFSGDGNGDGTIDMNDKVPDWQIQAGNTGFMSNDYNMDGQVNNLDKDDYWVPNSNKYSQIPE